MNQDPLRAKSPEKIGKIMLKSLKGKKEGENTLFFRSIKPNINLKKIFKEILVSPSKTI
jgi:hypothetical protein